MEISFQSWKKQNNQGLCDYKQIVQEIPAKFQIIGSGVIYRNINTFDLLFLPINKVPKQGNLNEYQPLLFITEADQRYKITDLKKQQGVNEPLTLVMPTILQKQNDETIFNEIFQGSILYLGKVKVEVMKIKIENNYKKSCIYEKNKKHQISHFNRISISNYVLQSQIKENKKNSSSSQNIQKVSNSIKSSVFSVEDENPICKVCYSKSLSKNNTLISVCQCSGSAKYIHQNCLKQWILTKSNFKKREVDNGKLIYSAQMKGFKCQICKQIYCPNVIFEILFRDQQKKMLTFIVLRFEYEIEDLLYFVNLDEIPHIRVGRDKNQHIMIPQLSISRSHCEIRYRKDKRSCEIVDVASKFGTTVKKSSLIISLAKKTMKLQKGRSYIEVKKEKKLDPDSIFKKLIMCCEQKLP